MIGQKTLHTRWRTPGTQSRFSAAVTQTWSTCEPRVWLQWKHSGITETTVRVSKSQVAGILYVYICSCSACCTEQISFICVLTGKHKSVNNVLQITRRCKMSLLTVNNIQSPHYSPIWNSALPRAHRFISQKYLFYPWQLSHIHNSVVPLHQLETYINKTTQNKSQCEVISRWPLTKLASLKTYIVPSLSN